MQFLKGMLLGIFFVTFSCAVLISGIWIGKVASQTVMAADCAENKNTTFDTWVYKQPLTFRCEMSGTIKLKEHYQQVFEELILGENKQG